MHELTECRGVAVTAWAKLGWCRVVVTRLDRSAKTDSQAPLARTPDGATAEIGSVRHPLFELLGFQQLELNFVAGPGVDCQTPLTHSTQISHSMWVCVWQMGVAHM